MPLPSPASDADVDVRQLQARLAEAQDALHVSEERFRAFASATSDVVYRMNADWSEAGDGMGMGASVADGGAIGAPGREDAASM